MSVKIRNNGRVCLVEVEEAEVAESELGSISSSTDIASQQCVGGPRACWPTGEDMGLRVGRDGSVGRPRAEQHIQKVRMCLGITILPCQGYRRPHVAKVFMSIHSLEC